MLSVPPVAHSFHIAIEIDAPTRMPPRIAASKILFTKWICGTMRRNRGIVTVTKIVLNANLFPRIKELIINNGTDIQSDIKSIGNRSNELNVIDNPVIPPGVREYSMKNNLTASAVKNEDSDRNRISLIDILNIILSYIS